LDDGWYCLLSGDALCKTNEKYPLSEGWFFVNLLGGGFRLGFFLGLGFASVGNTYEEKEVNIV